MGWAARLLRNELEGFLNVLISGFQDRNLCVTEALLSQSDAQPRSGIRGPGDTRQKSTETGRFLLYKMQVILLTHAMEKQHRNMQLETSE